MRACLPACLCVCVCVCVCVCARARAHVCARAHACVCDPTSRSVCAHFLRFHHIVLFRMLCLLTYRRGGGDWVLVNLAAVNLTLGNLVEARTEGTGSETWSMQSTRGLGDEAGSPWIWRGKFGGQIETPNFPHQIYRPPNPPIPVTLPTIIGIFTTSATESYRAWTHLIHGSMTFPALVGMRRILVQLMNRIRDCCTSQPEHDLNCLAHHTHTHTHTCARVHNTAQIITNERLLSDVQVMLVLCTL